MRTNADNWVRSSFVLNPKNLGNRVLTGASFTILTIIIRTTITIGSMAVLARLLEPSDFGYVAMATVITEFAALLGSFGFANILIQKQKICRLHLDTVFWAGTMVGLFLCILVQFLSLFSILLFADPYASELLRALGLIFIFSGMTHAHEAILYRLMRFRAEFWIQISVIGFRSLVAVIFALGGWGSWSLVAGAITGAVFNVLLIGVVVRYVPRFRFYTPFLISNWRTSGSYFGNGILYYLSMNVDVALIGRYLGANTLGYYQNARALTDEIRGRIAMPLQRVLFPAFSAIQNDPSRLQLSVIRSARLLALIIVPIGFGISAVADELVPLLYGAKWLAMVSVLKMLGYSAALKGSTAIAIPLFNSQNRVDLGFKLNCFGTALTIAAVWLALPYGLNAVAMALALSSLYALITFRVGLGLIGLKTKHLIKILGTPILAALLMWLFIHWLRPGVQEVILTTIFRLTIMITFGAFTYTLTILALSPGYFREIRDLLYRYKKLSS